MALRSGFAPLTRLLPNRVKHAVKQAVKPFGTASARWRMLPEFLIIGARKGGTTSLYAYLAEHPCVLPPLEKEIYYFLDHYAKGEAWYRGHFPTILQQRLAERRAGRRVISGEATANYMYHPEVPDRVARMLPRVKLLAVLRNPVDRTISDYYHGVRHGRYTVHSRPLESWVERNLRDLRERPGDPEARRSLVGRGLYLEQLKTWLRVFPREQLLVLLSEDLYGDPDAAYMRITAFLDLPPHTLRHYDRLNANRYPQIDPSLRQRLAELFAPENERLARFLGLELGWDQAAAPHATTGAGHPAATG